MTSLVWRPVYGYEGLYSVSNDEQVRRDRDGYLFALRVRVGYLTTTLSKNGTRRCWSAHALVLEAFVYPRPEGMQANHKDGNKLNNQLDNLEWVTRSENMRHAFDTGLAKGHFPAHLVGKSINAGVKNGSAKLTPEAVKAIRQSRLPRKVLANNFGISLTTVRAVLTAKTWKDVL